MAPEPEDDFALVAGVADRLGSSLRATAMAMMRHRIVGGEVYDDIQERAPVLDTDKGFARGRGRRAAEARLSEVGEPMARRILGALDDNLLTERDVRNYLRIDGTEIDELAAFVGAEP